MHAHILPQMTESHSEGHCADLQTISTALTDHKEQTEREMEVSVESSLPFLQSLTNGTLPGTCI